MIPQNYRCTTACTHLLPVYLQTAGFSRVVPCMMIGAEALKDCCASHTAN